MCGPQDVFETKGVMQGISRALKQTYLSSRLKFLVTGLCVFVDISYKRLQKSILSPQECFTYIFNHLKSHFKKKQIAFQKFHPDVKTF